MAQFAQFKAPAGQRPTSGDVWSYGEYNPDETITEGETTVQRHYEIRTVFTDKDWGTKREPYIKSETVYNKEGQVIQVKEYKPVQDGKYTQVVQISDIKYQPETKQVLTKEKTFFESATGKEEKYYSVDYTTGKEVTKLPQENKQAVPEGMPKNYFALSDLAKQQVQSVKSKQFEKKEKTVKETMLSGLSSGNTQQQQSYLFATEQDATSLVMQTKAKQREVIAEEFAISKQYGQELQSKYSALYYGATKKQQSDPTFVTKLNQQMQSEFSLYQEKQKPLIMSKIAAVTPEISVMKPTTKERSLLIFNNDITLTSSPTTSKDMFSSITKMPVSLVALGYTSGEQMNKETQWMKEQARLDKEGRDIVVGKTGLMFEKIAAGEAKLVTKLKWNKLLPDLSPKIEKIKSGEVDVNLFGYGRETLKSGINVMGSAYQYTREKPFTAMAEGYVFSKVVAVATPIVKAVYKPAAKAATSSNIAKKTILSNTVTSTKIFQAGSKGIRRYGTTALAVGAGGVMYGIPKTKEIMSASPGYERQAVAATVVPELAFFSVGYKLGEVKLYNPKLKDPIKQPVSASDIARSKQGNVFKIEQKAKTKSELGFAQKERLTLEQMDTRVSYEKDQMWYKQSPKVQPELTMTDFSYKQLGVKRGGQKQLILDKPISEPTTKQQPLKADIFNPQTITRMQIESGTQSTLYPKYFKQPLSIENKAFLQSRKNIVKPSRQSRIDESLFNFSARQLEERQFNYMMQNRYKGNTVDLPRMFKSKRGQFTGGRQQLKSEYDSVLKPKSNKGLFGDVNDIFGGSGRKGKPIKDRLRYGRFNPREERIYEPKGGKNRLFTGYNKSYSQSNRFNDFKTNMDLSPNERFKSPFAFEEYSLYGSKFNFDSGYKPIQMSDFKQVQDTPYKQIQTTKLSLRSPQLFDTVGLPKLSVPPSSIEDFKFDPYTPDKPTKGSDPLIVGGVPSFGPLGGVGSSRKRIKQRQYKKYTPSLIAKVLGIKAKGKKNRVYTGLEIRGI